MTSRELIAAEAANTDRIALYREGLFWKAYERSAYALCTQVRPFKPTRKVLKTLAGGDIVSVGFPAIAADRILAGLVRLDTADAADGAAVSAVHAAASGDSSASCIADASSSAVRASSAADEGVASADPAASAAGASAEPHASSATRMVFAAPRPIVESDFRAWKSALPISVSIPRPSAAGVSAGRASFADAAVSADRASLDGSADVSGWVVVSTAEPSLSARPSGAVTRPRWWTRLGSWFTRAAAPSGSSCAVAAGMSAAGVADAVGTGFAATADAATVDVAGPAAGSAVADSFAGAAVAAERCLDALRKFEVADKTPMECMMFIAELKKQLLKN